MVPPVKLKLLGSTIKSIFTKRLSNDEGLGTYKKCTKHPLSIYKLKCNACFIPDTIYYCLHIVFKNKNPPFIPFNKHKGIFLPVKAHTGRVKLELWLESVHHTLPTPLKYKYFMFYNPFKLEKFSRRVSIPQRTDGLIDA